ACTNTMAVVDGTTGQVVASPTLNGGASGVAVDSITNRIFVGFGGVTVIDGSNNSVLSTIPIPACPSFMAFNPTNNRLYITDGCGQGLVVVDLNTNPVLPRITGVAGGGGIAVNPSLNHVYTNGLNGTLAIVNAASGAVIRNVDLQGNGAVG